MKSFIISLAALVVLFVFGCQENSITDPTATANVDKILPMDTYQHGTIKIDQTLSDPYPIMNSFYRIKGKIVYEHRMFYTDPIPPNAQRHVSLYLETNASLFYFCTVCTPSENDSPVGVIADVSEASVGVGGNFVSLYEKTFKIQGREDGMVLKCRFNVTSNGIEISAMWLALPNNVSAAKNNY